MDLKKITFLFAALLLCVSFSSCSDDEDDGGDIHQSYLNGEYLSTPTTANPNALILYYNGEELKNKEVTFYTSDHKTGKISFYDIISGDSESVISNITLTENKEEGGFDFTGTYSSKSSKKFKYTGNIVLNRLTLSLTEE